MSDSAPDDWFIAICQDCEPRLEQPFRDPATRDTWAQAHAGAVGHAVRSYDFPERSEEGTT